MGNGYENGHLYRHSRLERNTCSARESSLKAQRARLVRSTLPLPCSTPKTNVAPHSNGDSIGLCLRRIRSHGLGALFPLAESHLTNPSMFGKRMSSSWSTHAWRVKLGQATNRVCRLHFPRPTDERHHLSASTMFITSRKERSSKCLFTRRDGTDANSALSAKSPSRRLGLFSLTKARNYSLDTREARGVNKFST